MLNHTYTSVNNANLVDCGKKQHISSQPSPLLKDNFLGEFRTELDKKKVLANLGIASDLILEWENIKGDIGKSEALMKELDARTKYISDVVLTWENIKGDDVSKSKALVTELDARTTYVTKLGDFQNKVISVIDGLTYLETIVGGDQAAEAIQNNKIQVLETAKQSIETEISNIKTHLSGTIEVSIKNIKSSIQNIDTQLANITSLITVSEKEGNALELLKGETAGLYVPDLSGRLQTAEDSVSGLQQSISTIQGSLDTFVTKEQLGGDGEFDFVDQSDFSGFRDTVGGRLDDVEEELKRTVKTGEDGHVDTLFVNKISKNNDDGNIKITDSFEVESGIPLDVRFVKETIKELLALPVELCYEGMGVIVNSLSSLYILRKPEEGVLFNQDYVSNINNWKCPEDLVTEVITRAKYDEYAKAGSLSPSIFYYIIEDVEDEPNPDLYVGGVDSEEYKAALDRWLKYLQGQYMSGVWGQEIEKVVAGKASITAVNSLSSQITDLTKRVNLISGNVGNLNVEQVFTQVESNTQHINDLATKSEKLQQGITDLSNNVSTTYVTKQEIRCYFAWLR
jgi:cell division protein FtsB